MHASNTSPYKSWSVEVTADGIRTAWPDGKSSFFHALWLRDNCRCAECGDPVIGCRALRTSSLDLDVLVTSAELNDEGVLCLTWSDGHTGRFSGEWLREYAYDEESRRARLFHAPLWDRRFREQPPTIRYDNLCSDKDFHSLLCTLRDSGFCLVREAPTDGATLEAFAARIGPLRESNFGRVQDLVINPGQRSVAYSAIALKPHTDEPYRASAPGILMFQCIETDVGSAGESLFMDGFEIAEALRSEDNEAFVSLTKYNHRYRRFFEDDVDLMAECPLISVDEFDNVVGVRINDRVAAPLSIPSDQVPLYYRGLKRLLELAEDESRMMKFMLKPGDIVAFDNQRILHGRTELTILGRRHLQWAQVNRGDFFSRLRILADQLGISRNATPQSRGSH